jgi:hypothetical protein
MYQVKKQLESAKKQERRLVWVEHNNRRSCLLPAPVARRKRPWGMEFEAP